MSTVEYCENQCRYGDLAGIDSDDTKDLRSPIVQLDGGYSIWSKLLYIVKVPLATKQTQQSEDDCPSEKAYLSQ